MPRPKKTTKSPDLFNLEGKLTTAPCVPLIRAEVAAWKESRYKGATETTKELLNHWFRNEHRLLNEQKFAYHRSQQEAIETLIYIYEVAKVRTWVDLIERYAKPSGFDASRLPQEDAFARYCLKMATGSGKTKVMSLAIAWHYFNAMQENEQDYAKQFLILAPNVIVLERLRADFGGGRMFNIDPVIPAHLKGLMWNMEFYVRGDHAKAAAEGELYLTNIQQLYDRVEPEPDEPAPLAAVLGNAPKKLGTTTRDDFKERIIKNQKPLLVINDEAHHTHDDDSAWNNVIQSLARQVPMVSQLDFSATPRYSKGSLFTWTIYDYPLKQAIMDGTVKRPVKGLMKKMPVVQSRDVIKKYEAYLVAGVERWREYRTELARFEKKPVLFVMMNDTKEADEVAKYLQRKFPEDFAGEKTLVIHTDKSGEISKKDLEAARHAARTVDSNESPVNVIVSVMMLREGWDVENVTVVVGLRPYSSKAAILPEQAIGRGLRLMFRGKGYGYTERVDVIGTEKFMEFVSELERMEDLKFDEESLEKKVCIVGIEPLEEKREFDILIPELTPRLLRKTSLKDEIAALDVMKFRYGAIPMSARDLKPESFQFEGRDALTDEQLFERHYKIQDVQTVEEVVSYYADLVMKDLKLPSQFHLLEPKIWQFLEQKAYGKPVDLHADEMLSIVGSNATRHAVKEIFVKELRKVVVTESEPTLQGQGRSLMTIPKHPSSRLTVAAKKCVLNLVPCDNEFEKAFAKFLDKAEDVAAFIKLPDPFGFHIEYTDSATNMRYYEPDFAVRLTTGVHYIVETKGQEDVDVSFKDRAATLWCENATRLTGTEWHYLKIPQKKFADLQPDAFSDLAAITIAESA
ncbi:MAG: DEAD/DEAH box helicase family protein [Chloroherpetonaceae bacterium]